MKLRNVTLELSGTISPASLQATSFCGLQVSRTVLEIPKGFVAM